MRILPDHEWPFYDPDLDEHLKRLKKATANLTNLPTADLYGAILDIDVMLRHDIAPYLSVVLTTRQAVSILLSINHTLLAVDAFREEDMYEVSTALEIAEEFHALAMEIIDEILHGPGSMFIHVESTAA